MNSDDCIKLVPGISGSIVAVAGIYIAVKNLDRWRTEMTEKHAFETARTVLSKAIRLEREMKQARTDFRIHGAKYSVNRITEASKELELSLIDARVLWGADILEAASAAMFQQVHLLTALISMTEQQAQRVAIGNLSLEKIDSIVKEQAVLYGVVEGGDEKFGKPLAEAVKLFENALRKYFPRRVSWSDELEKLLARIQQTRVEEESNENSPR